MNYDNELTQRAGLNTPGRVKLFSRNEGESPNSRKQTLNFVTVDTSRPQKHASGNVEREGMFLISAGSLVSA